MIRWVVYHEHITGQGRFVMTWPNEKWDNWIPSDLVFIDGNDVIHWSMIKPAGVLLKYPCGTKRFIAREN